MTRQFCFAISIAEGGPYRFPRRSRCINFLVQPVAHGRPFLRGYSLLNRAAQQLPVPIDHRLDGFAGMRGSKRLIGVGYSEAVAPINPARGTLSCS